MTAFLFDEDHPDMEMIFGPQCASKIIRRLEVTPDLAPLRLHRGGLLHARYCYQVSEITLREKKDAHSEFSTEASSQHFTPNYDHFLTIICDLAETMYASGSSMSEDELKVALAKKNIWVVVIQELPDELLTDVVEAVQTFGPFLGWVKVDWQNPVHADLFAKSLFQDMFVDAHGICKASDRLGEAADIEEEMALLNEYGSKHQPRLVDHETFSKLAPPLPKEVSPNERAMTSLKRVEGDDPGHRSKLSGALAHDFEASGDFRTFSAKRPEDGIEFVIPEPKLTQYLLNLDHPKGAAKARFFKDSLDILANDWRYLSDQICQAAYEADFYRLEVTGYGVMHGALLLVTGRNGRKAVLETGWKLGADGPASLVTAYPGDENRLETLKAFPVRVPEPACKPPERWKRIHQYAHDFGMESGERKIPTPMVLERWGTIWEGACGFGWVFLPDARAPFARWAVKAGIGYASKPGVQIYSKLQTQSVEKNLAYAIGYAQVLKANGIDCRADSRLD